MAGLIKASDDGAIQSSDDYFDPKNRTFLKYDTYSENLFGLPEACRPYINHERKKETFLKDGTSFLEFEKKFREKYSNLDIARIDLTNVNTPVGYITHEVCQISPRLLEHENVREYGLGQEEEYNLRQFAPFIFADTKSCEKLDSAEFQWALLHECGHLQKPYVKSGIIASQISLTGLTAFFWGMHKAKPYKNVVTKLGSKCLATSMLPRLFAYAAERVEERRADNFANKHADRIALHGGLGVMKLIEEFKKEHISHSSSLVSKLPYCIAENIVDPVHPTDASRVRKIKKEITDRNHR